jgi:hypothetical protein
LYAMVTATLPFDGSNLKQLSKRIHSGKIYYPDYLSEGILISRKMCCSLSMVANKIDGLEVKDLIGMMLNPKTDERAEMCDLVYHPWTNKGFERELRQQEIQKWTPKRMINRLYVKSYLNMSLSERGTTLLSVLDRCGPSRKASMEKKWKTMRDEALASTFSSCTTDPSVTPPEASSGSKAPLEESISNAAGEARFTSSPHAGPSTAMAEAQQESSSSCAPKSQRDEEDDDATVVLGNEEEDTEEEIKEREKEEEERRREKEEEKKEAGDTVGPLESDCQGSGLSHTSTKRCFYIEMELVSSSRSSLDDEIQEGDSSERARKGHSRGLTLNQRLRQRVQTVSQTVKTRVQDWWFRLYQGSRGERLQAAWAAKKEPKEREQQVQKTKDKSKEEELSENDFSRLMKEADF